jgi:FAD/FMN-containing dehydrogenase
MMMQNTNPAAPSTDASNHGGAPPRRNVLLGVGAAGAAVMAGRFFGAGGDQHSLTPADAATRARSARPAWLSGPGTTPTPHDWDALQHALSTGKLVRPGQPDYFAAKRLFDPRFNYLHPAGIAYCKRPADVGACLTFVKKFGLPVRVRSGGHSYEGWSSVNNGLVIDVSEMNSLHIGSGTVTVGSGIDLINFYSGLAAHGQAVPGGSCPTVGIAGLALGGGVGVLTRKFGLTSDAIESLDVVLADGSTVTANATNNHRDLYWASRGGGGGNFGVTTSFTFRTHPLTNLVLYYLQWPWSKAARVVSAWQSWAPHAPDALWSNLHLSAATGGAPGISVGGSYVGSVGGAQAELNKLYHLVGSAPSYHSVANNSYLEAMLIEAGCSSVPVHACDTPPGGNLPFSPAYAKSDFFNKPLDRAGINTMLGGIERLARVRGTSGGAGTIALDACGGAMNRVKPAATAFVHRKALYLAQYSTVWNWPGSKQGVANQLAWLLSYYRALHPFASGEAYQNYIDSSLKDWQQAYYGDNYFRLQEVKGVYDPHQLFRFPQSITPPAKVTCFDTPDC